MNDVALTGALAAVIVALTKVIEWLSSKFTDSSEETYANLRPEQSRQLREIHESMLSVKKDIAEVRVDNDKHLETMRQIAECMRKVAESQEKTATLLERIDRRMEVEEAVRFQRSPGAKK